VRQFVDLAEGDRFFYRFDPQLADLVDQIDATSLSDILMRNSNLTSMGSDVFHVAPGTPPRESASSVSIALAGADAVLRMRGADPAATFILQRSPDAQAWQTIASGLTANAGQVVATDVGAAATSRRLFYRFATVLE